LVLDARLYRGHIVHNRTSINIAKGIYWYRHLLPGCDDRFLIIAGEYRRSRDNFEPTGGLKQMHNRREGVASRDINVGAIGHVLDNLAEIDQIGGIDNPASRYYRCHASTRRCRGGRDRDRRVVSLGKYGVVA